MSVLLQVHQISKSYGSQIILEDATTSFSRHQKIGMIGRNGAGKSTLCRIITGEEEMDSGRVTRNAELRLSYLEQHDSFKLDETVIEFLARKSGKEEWQCGEVAGRFQLKGDLLYTNIGSLAGGYRTRVKLTAMLLNDPNFLILDEPTNYLDLSTLVLLENFLQDFKGGFLIVSHDREFLKRTCSSTLEAENGHLTFYPGEIETYFEFKEEQFQQKLAYNKGVEAKKKQLQDFVDRFKAKASTATRAKSKMKQIEKLQTIEIEHPMGTVNIRIPPVEKKGGVALFCEDLVIGYPGKEVARGIQFDIDRGSHVAVLGDNGQGKTTFLRTLATDLQTLGGSFRWGTALKVAYYAQHVFSTLRPDDEVYSHLSRLAAPGVLQQDILDLAGSFLFKGQDVKKKVSVLSGGERARLCLAGLLLTKSQVLLLDEPTNHLDFETVEALAGALKTYEGTVFFISHDRTFVNLIATHILEVKDGRVKRYPGTYEDYVYHLEKRTAEELAADGYGPREKKKKTGPAVSKSEIQATRHKIQEAEKKIEKLKKEQDALLVQCAADPQNIRREHKDRLDELTELLAEAEEDWLDLQEVLEEMED